MRVLIAAALLVAALAQWAISAPGASATIPRTGPTRAGTGVQTGLQMSTTEAVPPLSGYWLAEANGGVFTFGGVRFAGPATIPHLTSTVVGMARTPSSSGYWLAEADGGVLAFGDAGYFGSLASLAPALRPPSPVVAIASTFDGQGYWLATAAGGVYAFGDAPFFGSVPHGAATSRMVAMAARSDGQGYWLTSAAGGVYAFGAAGFFGGAALLPLVRPIVSMAPTISGSGYWLTAADGGVFSYGDAAFYGSTGAIKLNRPIVGMTASLTGLGYWFVASDGGVFSFGDAPFRGSTGGVHLASPIVAMVAGRTLVPYAPGQNGYDISFPQCGAPLPSGGQFGIVGINNGRAFTKNPCLHDEWQWAGQSGTVYINLNAPNGDPKGLNGPAGQCTGNNTGCMAYNYGFNAAIDAFQYGTSPDGGVLSGVWWLDIETSNTWDSNTFNNDQTIQGAIDALTAEGVIAGIYSTGYQWGIIAGSYAPKVPEWVPTGADLATAKSYCDGTHSFGAGGIPWLTQYGSVGNDFDQDYVCPQ